MNRVVKVLMERDGMTEAEAKMAVREGQSELHEAISQGLDVEDVFSDIFGLEPDYLFDVL